MLYLHAWGSGCCRRLSGPHQCWTQISPSQICHCGVSLHPPYSLFGPIRNSCPHSVCWVEALTAHVPVILLTALNCFLCMQGEGNDADNAAAEPEQAPVLACPRSASRANTPSLDTSDPGRKKGGVLLTCSSIVPCVGPVLA